MTLRPAPARASSVGSVTSPSVEILTRNETITTSDGVGFAAHVAVPAGDNTRPGVIVIQEIFGLTDHIADGFADHGAQRAAENAADDPAGDSKDAATAAAAQESSNSAHVMLLQKRCKFHCLAPRRHCACQPGATSIDALCM